MLPLPQPVPAPTAGRLTPPGRVVTAWAGARVCRGTRGDGYGSVGVPGPPGIDVGSVTSGSLVVVVSSGSSDVVVVV